jgi:hypothetical protein
VAGDAELAERLRTLAPHAVALEYVLERTRVRVAPAAH